jgi:hypothetical protein
VLSLRCLALRRLFGWVAPKLQGAILESQAIFDWSKVSVKPSCPPASQLFRSPDFRLLRENFQATVQEYDMPEPFHSDIKQRRHIHDDCSILTGENVNVHIESKSSFAFFIRDYLSMKVLDRNLFTAGLPTGRGLYHQNLGFVLLVANRWHQMVPRWSYSV